MMGLKKEFQSALFYEFCLDDHVPTDHLLRLVDRFVDLDDIRFHLAPFYSSTGRPSVDPELMIRMLLLGYIMGIRFERRLCEEVHLNLTYRWFCRLDLVDPVSDHSTFSKNRHGRFRDSDLLRRVFEIVVARCIDEGLVSGQRFAVDASLIEADTNRQNSTSKEEWHADEINPQDAPRAVREYLETLDDAAFGAATPMMYVRFPLSLRNVEDLLHERGIDISHETIRYWWNRFGPIFAADIKRKRIQSLRCHSSWKWHLDEVFVKINGEMHYLWRAVDHEGEVLDSVVIKRRDKNAALKLLRKLCESMANQKL